jgi:hypothetical protein
VPGTATTVTPRGAHCSHLHHTCTSSLCTLAPATGTLAIPPLNVTHLGCCRYLAMRRPATDLRLDHQALPVLLCPATSERGSSAARQGNNQHTVLKC